MRSYAQRLRIWETNYGRDAGWVIVRRGEIIAVLTAPRFEDLFWDSYRMEVVAAAPGAAAADADHGVLGGGRVRGLGVA